MIHERPAACATFVPKPAVRSTRVARPWLVGSRTQGFQLERGGVPLRRSHGVMAEIGRGCSVLSELPCQLDAEFLPDDQLDAAALATEGLLAPVRHPSARGLTEADGHGPLQEVRGLVHHVSASSHRARYDPSPGHSDRGGDRCATGRATHNREARAMMYRTCRSFMPLKHGRQILTSLTADWG